MMRRQTISKAVALAAASLCAACAQPPKTLYMWEGYPRQQYQTLLREGVNSQQQIIELEAHMAKARAAGMAVPPGLRAHLGMLQLAEGKPDQARALWEQEKAAFPESASYMDQLLGRLDAQAKLRAAQ
jgi:hypothetical protein